MPEHPSIARVRATYSFRVLRHYLGDIGSATSAHQATAHCRVNDEVREMSTPYFYEVSVSDNKNAKTD